MQATGTIVPELARIVPEPGLAGDILSLRRHYSDLYASIEPYSHRR